MHCEGYHGRVPSIGTRLTYTVAADRCPETNRTAFRAGNVCRARSCSPSSATREECSSSDDEATTSSDEGPGTKRGREGCSSPPSQQQPNLNSQSTEAFLLWQDSEAPEHPLQGSSEADHKRQRRALSSQGSEPSALPTKPTLSADCRQDDSALSAWHQPYTADQTDQRPPKKPQIAKQSPPLPPPPPPTQGLPHCPETAEKPSGQETRLQVYQPPR